MSWVLYAAWMDADDYIRLMTGFVHYSYILYLSHSLSDAILSLGSFNESLIKYLSRGPR